MPAGLLADRVKKLTVRPAIQAKIYKWLGDGPQLLRV
jgi:hypothetical protein